MEQVINALWRNYELGHSWREIGAALGITGQYCMMIAKGERRLREKNPLRQRILDLTLLPKRVRPEPLVVITSSRA